MAHSVDSILPPILSTTYCPRMLLFMSETLKTNTRMAPMLSTLKNEMIPITRLRTMCSFSLRDYLYFFLARTRQTTNAIMAARRMTGSASMNTGIVPDVSVTRVEERITNPIPAARIIRPD